jgi:hypothetical protein
MKYLIIKQKIEMKNFILLLLLSLGSTFVFAQEYDAVLGEELNLGIKINGAEYDANAAISGGGVQEIFAEADVSGMDTLTVTGITFENVLILFENLSSSSGGNFLGLIQGSGETPTWFASGYNLADYDHYDSGNSSYKNGSEFSIFYTDGFGPSYTYNGEVLLRGVNSATPMNGKGYYSVNDGASIFGYDVFLTHDTTTPTTAFRIYIDGGATFTTGKIRVLAWN